LLVSATCDCICVFDGIGEELKHCIKEMGQETIPAFPPSVRFFITIAFASSTSLDIADDGVNRDCMPEEHFNAAGIDMTLFA
jgi:hypothetical protein